jgi:predicted RNA-binding Zn-ribbon protein involved in translation (DUF1610 family)
MPDDSATEEVCPNCGHPEVAHTYMYDGTHGNYIGTKCRATIHRPARGYSYPCPCERHN